MLSLEKKAELKNKLEQELSVLEIELTDIGKINPSNPHDWQGTSGSLETGTADKSVLADRFEENFVNEAIVSQLEVRFEEVKKALERMEANTYGFCIEDNKEIPEDRLDANPAATTCLDHAE